MDQTLLIKLFKKLQFSLLFFFLPQQVLGAACCGGGLSLPSIITTDDKAQLALTYSVSHIHADVFSNGVWQKRVGQDKTQTLKLDFSHIFLDRWQAGTSIPVQIKNKDGIAGGQSSGFGDVSTILGYEYLPDWDYNPWRPKGIGFLSLTLPTGKSIYESNNANSLESRGRGFWALGIGTVLTKSWLAWDVSSTFEIHRSLKKSVHNSQIDGTIRPGWGGSFSIGPGYNINDLRLGAQLSWNYEDPIGVTGTNSSQGSLQRYATGSLSLSYLLPKEWSATLIYSDQTLFGHPLNTTLSKTVSFLFIKRWQR